MYVDSVVLGCGWAGILVARRLASYGYRVICLEKENNPGGLLRSEYFNNFVIDIGGSHVIFSKDKNILDKILSVLGDNICSHNRLSYVKLMKSLVPYPFENGLYVLPVEERYEALVSFLEALFSLSENWVPRNLEEWIYGFFGKWIADKYLVPYNKKIWKRPLNQLDVDWIYTPGRLPVPDWRDVVKSALGIPTIGYSEQAKFYYPARGGIYALFESVYKEARVRGVHVLANYVIKSIRKKENLFILNNEIECKRIYSTIPIPDLVNVLGEELNIDHNKLNFFDYNKVAVVAIALSKPAPSQHWIYVPDEDIIFHRYAWLSNYSPHNSPPGTSLLIAEITIPKEASVSNNIVDKVLHDFEKLDVFKSHEVIFTRLYIHEYGYPIHTIGLSTVREEILEEIEEYGVFSMGRWGSWRYLNMDMVYAEIMKKLNNALN
ncbi:MAG: FAD-dependent oxidoreductase [Desulfurococcaceae archaeon]